MGHDGGASMAARGPGAKRPMDGSQGRALARALLGESEAAEGDLGRVRTAINRTRSLASRNLALIELNELEDGKPAIGQVPREAGERPSAEDCMARRGRREAIKGAFGRRSAVDMRMRREQVRTVRSLKL